MMKCEQAELRMAELLAGEILPAERSALEQHLLDCDACRSDFELARTGLRIEWADVGVPKEVIDATLASFREPPALVRVFRWATAAAAVFGVAVLLMTSSRAPAPLVSSGSVPLRRAPQRELLATMQDAVVGALVCKDEEGRPVGELGLKSHEVSVEILDGIAKTTVEENFENHTNRRLEGTFNFPLPSDASISRLALEVNGKIEEGTCLERERAREVFESIVRKMQDPALLEWQPGGFFKCRVFPIEPRSTKRVIVAYTQALPCFKGKMTYVYPLASEKTRTHPPEEVRISVQARFSGALAKIESPSHHLDVQRRSPNEASMAFRAANYRPNNDFVVTMEPGDEEVRVVSHKPVGEDGYFACFVTPRGGGERAPGRYAFVLDVSASISAPRLEVAKRLVRAMMEKRIEGDRFEILAHHIEVERSGEVDLRAANDFMDRLRPIGGSDVLKALLAAGDAEVIYIGKGSPSFGESDPSKILEAVRGRRIRTIAVGSDANGLLLERLGGMMRVSPNDDVPKRVAEIAATLGSPVLTGLKIEGEGLSEVVGLRDLFYGERLVVSGRYGAAATKLLITGSGYRREVEVAFPAKEEANNYVRRLWAQRKVADLLAQGAAKKPEVTALGVKHQIMTPYTSFLVLETEQMWKDFQLQREVQKQDQVLGDGDKTRSLLQDGTDLYKQGKFAEASSKFEEAFQRNPSSDQVYAFIKRAGEDMIGRMMNDPDRNVQDIGRRLMEVAKPGDVFREGKPGLVVGKVPEKPAIKKPDPAPLKGPPQNEERAGRSTDIPDAAGQEDPKAKAIREAYEEQLRRDRQEVTINMKNATVDQIVDEFRRQRGWNIVVDNGKTNSSTADYEKFMREALVRNPEAMRSGKSTGIPDEEDATVEPFLRPAWTLHRASPTADATIDELRYLEGWDGKLDGRRGPGSSTQVWRDEYLSVTALQKFALVPDAASSLKTLSTAESDFRATDRDWNHVNDFWTYSVEGLYSMTSAAQAGQGTRGRLSSDREKLIELSVSSAVEAHAAEKIVEEQALRQLEGQLMELKGKELFAKRQPKGLSEMREEFNDEDKAIGEKLRSIRVNLAFENAPLTAIVDHVRKLSGLNIHISGIDNPDAEMISVKTQDAVLDAALRRILEPRNHTYVVRDGVVLITKASLIPRVMALSEDGSRLFIAGGGMEVGRFLKVTRESKFVAIVRMERVLDGGGEARVVQALSVGRVLPGDLIGRVPDLAALLAGLPAEVRDDLASRANQQTIRAKMGLKE